jgi:hypothetical protein
MQDLVWLFMLAILTALLPFGLSAGEPEPAPQLAERPDLEAAIAIEIEHQERLAKELAPLQTQLPKVAAEPSTSAPMVDEDDALAGEARRLEQALAARQAAVQTLANELARIERPSVDDAVGTPVVSTTKLESVHLELAGNRVAPVDTSHFRMQNGRTSSGQSVVVATRVRQGESVADLRNTSSRIARLIRDLDPTRQYLALTVRSDSYEVFRAVRELARAENVDLGWEPYSGEQGRLLFGSGGTGVSVQTELRNSGGTP